MKTIPAALAAILGILAIPGFAAAPTSNVNVTNTPLPVSVTNPTTTVQVGNTSPIGVSVANPLDLVKASANAHFQITNGGAPSADGSVCSATFTVPTGQRLLIHYIGFRLISTALMQGGDLHVSTSSSISDSVFFTRFNAVPAVAGVNIGGQVVDVAADGGNTVFAFILLSALDLSAHCDFAISGTLVSNP